jgi:signal transduction histidine kinase
MPNQASEFILIVDDNPTNLSVLQKALKAAGLNVRLAEDGQSAIAQIHRSPPVLILLDVQMPIMDGFELCKYLQADLNTCDIPIIFMTALADTENKVKGLSLGAVDYITKPFEQEEVLARVQMHLRIRRLTKDLQQMKDSLAQQVVERTASLQKAQVQLVQQEKLTTLGQLVTGIAHEINNPLGCIISNIAPAYEYMAILKQALRLYQAETPCPSVPTQQELADLEVEYIIEDLPKVLDSIKISADRIQELSTSLRNFSRSDANRKIPFNLHQGIDATLLILQHRLKASHKRPAIQVIKKYCDLPEIDCFPGQLNQVFMNLIANAIDALEESNQGRSLAEIKAKSNWIEIETHLDQRKNCVQVAIRDNGTGIPDEIKERIFEYLFTTKGVDQGTGLGLAIVAHIIKNIHCGQLTFSSQVGEGTEFVIQLPI